jgi:hypothetical protein
LGVIWVTGILPLSQLISLNGRLPAGLTPLERWTPFSPSVGVMEPSLPRLPIDSLSKLSALSFLHNAKMLFHQHRISRYLMSSIKLKVDEI